MAKHKDSNRWNITNIIHDLKESYAKQFREKVPFHLEPALIEAAREVKKGAEVEWYKDEDGTKKIRIHRKISYV